MARALLFCIILALLLNVGWARAALAIQLGASPCDPQLLAQARERVASQFGAVLSAPLIGCLQQPVLGMHISHGQTRFALLLPAVVLLGPQGQTPDVAAHEWSHAELSQRVGVLTRSYSLPTWFDEGLAMQLDHRPNYNLQALQRLLQQPGAATLRLHGLGSPSTFFATERASARLHYAFARCVVERWAAAQQPADLHRWLDGLHWSRPFAVDTFADAERHCLHGTG